MEKEKSWTVCKECKGQGKKSRGLSNKLRTRYQQALTQFQENNNEGEEPIRPKAPLQSCVKCKGAGIVKSDVPPLADKENYPHIAIIGGGIGGVALAVACLHRGIPFTLYERDANFEARSQGYGLTLQQASTSIKAFGITSLKEGVVSTKHVVHTTDGKVIGEWGIRKWLQSDNNTFSKRTNVHIARQALRLELLEQLGENAPIKWGCQLIDFKENKDGTLALNFLVSGEIHTGNADLIVGADGIRSVVRKLLICEEKTPLRYLGCIVILGICPLSAIENTDSELLDSATVFQTANGNERIYVMPYTADAVMWQLSFPMSEDDAKALSSKGADALKAEAIKRTQWHSPVPQILNATLVAQVSGYPVYDRALLSPEDLKNTKKVTLIGDAAHPMSPFKGQGANQALLDALLLARGIVKGCKPSSGWREFGIRAAVLNDYEAEMLERSAVKVKDSADAAEFLHSDIVLFEGDEPRGRVLKK